MLGVVGVSCRDGNTPEHDGHNDETNNNNDSNNADRNNNNNDSDNNNRDNNNKFINDDDRRNPRKSDTTNVHVLYLGVLIIAPYCLSIVLSSLAMIMLMPQPFL